METSLSYEKLIAAEDTARTIVLRQYQSTLILISFFLVCICLFGSVGNSLVIYIIGRDKIFRPFLSIWLRIRRAFSSHRKSDYQVVDIYDRKNQTVSIRETRIQDRPSRRKSHSSALPRLSAGSEIQAESSVTITSPRYEKSAFEEEISRKTRRTQFGFKNNSILLIFILACNDFIICTVDITITIFLTVWEMKTYDFMCRFHVILKASMLSVSVLLLLLIAIDRWLLICFVPSRRISRNGLMLTIFLIYLVGIAWAIPMGLHHGVITQFEVSTIDHLMPNNNGAMTKEDLKSIPNFFANQSYSDSLQRKFLPPLDKEAIISGFLSHGSCAVDERFISGSRYRDYQLSIFVLFSVVFILVCFIYGSIFSFVWWHQRRWRGRQDVMEREKSRPSNSSGMFPKILTNKRISSSHTHNTFGSSHSKEDFSSGIRVCCTIREEGPGDGSSPTSLHGASGSTDLVNTETKQNRTPSTEVRVTHEKISLMEKCGSVDDEPKTNDSADVTNNQPKIQHNSSVQSELQTTLLSQPERSVLINRDAHPKPLKAVQRRKRSHHPRDSMKSKTGRRVRNANKHLRTAVMFILITASFLISYLPTLLITNGFIWRVEWETTSASATDEIFNVTLEKWIGYMKSASIDGSGDNHTKLHLGNLNSGVRRTTETESASIYSYALKDHFHMSELTYHLRRLVHFLYFVNSATNPLIYFFLNLKFRGELRQLYRRMRLHCAR